MKSIVFDSGPIITFALNNLLWVLDPLKNQFKGDFYLTPAVRRELIDKPINTKRFKFEALQVLSYITKETLIINDHNQLKAKSQQLLELANQCFEAKGNFIRIVHQGEMEVVALALLLKSEAAVIDERTTRYLIEKPNKLKRYMEKKLHTKVNVDGSRLNEFQRQVKGLNVIRSVELLTVAYELGLLDIYLTGIVKTNMEDPRHTLLDSVLWGAKLNGCAVTAEEINSILQFEAKSS